MLEEQRYLGFLKSHLSGWCQRQESGHFHLQFCATYLIKLKDPLFLPRVFSVRFGHRISLFRPESLRHWPRRQLWKHRELLDVVQFQILLGWCSRSSSHQTKIGWGCLPHLVSCLGTRDPPGRGRCQRNWRNRHLRQDILEIRWSRCQYFPNKCLKQTCPTRKAHKVPESLSLAC